jgi:hypothetical protein
MTKDHFLRLAKWLSVLPVVLGMPATLAWGHSDILLANVGGKVTIGGANELETVDENFDLTTKVFTGVMIPNFPPFDPKDQGRDEPGFFALASGSADLPAGATALPPSAAVSVAFPSFSIGSLSDSMFYWNGTGAINFQRISSVQPGFAMSLVPNPVGTTSASGALHEHAVFELDNGGAGVPANGVYLVSPTVSVPGLATSKRFYMTWLVDSLITDDEAAEELEGALESDTPVVGGKSFQFFLDATDYVQDNLVPEPCSGALFAVGLAIAGALSRKRLH